MLESFELASIHNDFDENISRRRRGGKEKFLSNTIRDWLIHNNSHNGKEKCVVGKFFVLLILLKFNVLYTKVWNQR